MRTRKYRAWHREAKKLLFGTPSQIFKWLEEGQPIEIMDFVGLLDKNGREVFESDICLIKFDINKVEDYIYNSLTTEEKNSGQRIFVVESPLFNNQPELNADYIEVIGNIFHNPELISTQ